MSGRNLKLLVAKKTFDCVLCEKVFETSRELKFHQFTHSPLEEDYPDSCRSKINYLIPCFICGNHYSSLGNLKRHYRTSLIHQMCWRKIIREEIIETGKRVTFADELVSELKSLFEKETFIIDNQYSRRHLFVIDNQKSPIYVYFREAYIFKQELWEIADNNEIFCP